MDGLVVFSRFKDPRISLMLNKCGYIGSFLFNEFLANQINCKTYFLKSYIDDCINVFELFKSNGEVFWSEYLTNSLGINSR